MHRLTLEEIRKLPRGTKLEMTINGIAWHPCELAVVHEEEDVSCFCLVIFGKDTSGYGYGWSLQELENSFGYTEGSYYWARPDDLRLVCAPTLKPAPPKVDGCVCLDCKEFYAMAKPNCSEGLVCYSCRSSNKWKWQGKGFF